MAKKDIAEQARLRRLRFKTIADADSHNRETALQDINFTFNVDSGQWDDSVRTERSNDGRPCLTANKLRKYVAQVANKMRDSRVAMDVIPVDDKGDTEIAAIYDALLRQIEYQSKAQNVYAKGAIQMLSGGFGYWRIATQYVDDSFDDQEIRILPIENQFSVYMHPTREYCFIREGMTKAEFEAAYPNVESRDVEQSGQGEEWALWYEGEKVFVADYYFKEPYEKKMVRTVSPDGVIGIFELSKDLTKEMLESQGLKVVKERTVKSHKVKYQKVCGNDEPLEEGEWVGSDLPIIEVKGDEINVAGKVYKRSLIVDAKDPQKGYNYWWSAVTEKVALSPKAPYIVTPQQIKGHEPMWNTLNKKNNPYLLYNATGQGIPQRTQPSHVEAGEMSMLNIVDRDIMDTLGMYEASLGGASNERSGKAINARANRSDMGTYHLVANWQDAILETCRQIMEIIPKVYDTERVIRLRGREENQVYNVTVNQVLPDGRTINDLSVGKYDIEANLKTSQSRRQEAAEYTLQALQYSPEAAHIILPFVFKYADVEGAKEMGQALIEWKQQQQRAQMQQQGMEMQKQAMIQEGQEKNIDNKAGLELLKHMNKEGVA